MSLVYHTISLDLDSGVLSPLPVNLPIGFVHVIRLDLFTGKSGYQLALGGTVSMFFDSTFPVDETNPVHSILPISWVWNPEHRVYEAGFDATQRPISLIGLTTLAARLRVVDSVFNVEKSFQVGFRNVSLPDAVDHCNVTEGIPPRILNYIQSIFRYTLLPDAPDIVEQFFNGISSLDDSQLATLTSTFGDLGTAVAPIVSGETMVSVQPPTNFDSTECVSVMVRRISGADTVEINSQIDTSGTRVDVEIITPALVDGTHEAVLLFRK